jgi:predicted DNA-binding transcriptional regulator YafY
VPLEIVPQKDGSIIFETEVAGTEEIKFWVMSWGSNTLVLEPGSLREEIRAESEALLGKYGHKQFCYPERIWIGDPLGVLCGAV